MMIELHGEEVLGQPAVNGLHAVELGGVEQDEGVDAVGEFRLTCGSADERALGAREKGIDLGYGVGEHHDVRLAEFIEDGGEGEGAAESVAVDADVGGDDEGTCFPKSADEERLLIQLAASFPGAAKFLSASSGWMGLPRSHLSVETSAMPASMTCSTRR